MAVVMAPCAAFYLVYIDNLLVYSPSREQYYIDVEKVFQALTQAQLCVKSSKCTFGTSEVEYLGHVVFPGRIDMANDKKTAILKWESLLTTSKQVRQFIGLTSYYRNFIPRFATIAEPLTRLIDKHTRMKWGYESQYAMDELKAVVSKAIALTVWDPNHPMRIATDTSKVGLGVILE